MNPTRTRNLVTDPSPGLYERRLPRPVGWCADLYDGHPHAVLVVDAAGRLLHGNPASVWLAGNGRVPSLFDLLELRACPDSAEGLRAALRDGAAWRGPLGVKAADAATRVVQLHLIAQTGGGGAGAERVVIVERERVIDRVPALMWSADAAFSFTWVSHGFVEFTGRDAEALLGRRWLECVHPQDRERCTGIYEASQQARRPFSMDLRVRRNDDEYRCMLVQAVPDPAGYTGLAVDIHERSQIETQLAENSEARRRNDLRHGRFLAALSHELRSPLAPISNAASLLRTLETDNPTLGRLREILERQVARLRRVLDDLIDVTQALQGELTLVRQPVALHEIVDGAIAQNQRTLDALGHQVVLSVSARPIVLEGDSVRLTQMLANLLANAARCTPEAASIGISVGVVDEQIRIAVKDPGRGIAPEALPRVFDLFAQPADGSPGGLGVGLTLARRIAQNHGGDVVAHSAGLGTGSEFVVTLPLKMPANLRALALRRAASSPASS